MRRDAPVVVVERLADQLGQRERQPALDEDADHAERVPAQPERILVAGRRLSDAEQARERVELVGERDRSTARLGQRVAGEARAVVRLDRIGDRSGSPSWSA